MSLLKRGEGFEKSLAAIAMLSIVALAAILVFLLTQALPIFNEVSLFTFLLGTEWYPTGPNPDFEIGALLAASLAVAATSFSLLCLQLLSVSWAWWLWRRGCRNRWGLTPVLTGLTPR